MDKRDAELEALQEKLGPEFVVTRERRISVRNRRGRWQLEPLTRDTVEERVRDLRLARKNGFPVLGGCRVVTRLVVTQREWSTEETI